MRYGQIMYHFYGYLKINKSISLKIKKGFVKADIFPLNSIFVLPFKSCLWQYILPFIRKVFSCFSLAILGRMDRMKVFRRI